MPHEGLPLRKPMDPRSRASERLRLPDSNSRLHPSGWGAPACIVHAAKPNNAWKGHGFQMTNLHTHRCPDCQSQYECDDPECGNHGEVLDELCADCLTFDPEDAA